MFKKYSSRITGFIFLFPAVAFIIYSSVIPFVWNIALSFTNWDGFSPAKFVGLKNFEVVFKQEIMLKSLFNSIFYAFASTVGGVILGLLLATLVIELAGKEGSVFRLILFSPAMLPTAVVGLMFVFFYNPEMGLLNQFLKAIGAGDLTHVWLQDKGTAMLCIIAVAIWKCSGSIMLLCFAAMKTIPNSLYEAGKIDGTNFFKQTRYITYPLIKPMILLAAVNTLGAQFKSFDLIFVMTQGGPGNLTYTVPINMTKIAFMYGRFGNAAAQGVVFTVVVIASILLVNLLLRGEHYEY
ncbi:MAG: sugar ABC transporter permease [Vallitaleaceae bacterium]|nr:sugar ABC transporter permease [Vallitaleaceae bacterium]